MTPLQQWNAFQKYCKALGLNKGQTRAAWDMLTH